MKKAIIILVLLISVINQAQNSAEKYEGPIIDMHLHHYTEETYYVRPANGLMAPPNLVEFNNEMDKMLSRYNVVKAVLSSRKWPNDIYKDARFVPSYWTNEPPKDTIVFKKLIADGQLKVFGEIGAQYAGYTLSDPEFEPFLAICERNEIPVAIHTGGGPPNIANRCCPNFRLELGDPYKLEDVLVKYPNLKIYLMHAGGEFYQKTLSLMGHYQQVYVDLGVILWIRDQEMVYAKEFLKKAKIFGLLDRVMYGSDQMVWPHAIEKSINQLNSYQFLTWEDKANIFYNNAARFLSLSEEEIKKHHKQ